MRYLLLLGMLAFTGCMVTTVSPHYRTKIRKYRVEGKLEIAKEEIGYTVNPLPTFFWSLLPGANQIHIARKIEQSPYYEDFARDYPFLIDQLMYNGIVTLAFSWFPYVYSYTMPCQMSSGIFPDVARINNLAYMYHIDAQERAKKSKADPNTIK